MRVWAVISTPEERQSYEEEQQQQNQGSSYGRERLSAPVFHDQPFREFAGHTGEVLDLSWSKNNFLLSSSMDRTVRLWHISRAECLCTFKHKDFVTKLAFHPRDDRFFLAGSLDTMLRLWSIPDKAVAYTTQLPDLVTAVAFAPDGKTAIAGLLNGICHFYETEGLHFLTQIHVRSSRGKNARGSKITGIRTMIVPPPPFNPAAATTPVTIHPASPATSAPVSVDLNRRLRTMNMNSPHQSVAGSGEVKVLISSNDSRVRIYNMRDKSFDVKLKGHDNAYSQISASFSDDGKFVICGSESRKAFVWSLYDPDGNLLEPPRDRDKMPVEYFDAHGDMVTTAVFRAGSDARPSWPERRPHLRPVQPAACDLAESGGGREPRAPRP